MIRYDLTCAAGHAFDSWFQSSAAYDRLRGAGHVACPHCGDTQVEKALMAPAVAAGRQKPAPQPEPKPRTPLTQPATALEQTLAALKREVEANSEYVGMSFATEARRIHDGQAPERAIHGEARLEDARRLIEDGVPVTPLPFLSPRKTN